MAMKRKYRWAGFTAAQSAELWERWKTGEGLKSIGRALGKPSSCIFAHIRPSGGITAAAAATIPAGADPSGARGDLARPCCGPFGSLDGRWRWGARHRRSAGRSAAMADRGATAPRPLTSRAWKQALRPKPCKLAMHGQLRQAVATKLELNWSPEQIAGWLKRTCPGNEAWRVSHETIYRSLYVQARGVLKKELMAHLRSRRPIRRSRHATAKADQRGQHRRTPSRSASGQLRSRIGPCLATGKAICSAGRRTATSSPWSSATHAM